MYATITLMYYCRSYLEPYLRTFSSTQGATAEGKYDDEGHQGRRRHHRRRRRRRQT
jgi:hypothetical protein